MTKYRKRPLIIEAEQWFYGKEIEGVLTKMVGTCTSCPERMWFIKTLEGEMEVSEGDWIIKGIEGEIYCCKDSVFQKTYELVEE